METDDKKDFAIGSVVRFQDKVYAKPYRPYYDLYKDHVFQIDHFSAEKAYDDHVWLKCLDDKSIVVAGYIHLTDLEYSDLPF